jgi:hypothetical protein
MVLRSWETIGRRLFVGRGLSFRFHNAGFRLLAVKRMSWTVVHCTRYGDWTGKFERYPVNPNDMACAALCLWRAWCT